jgi:hypothetical protein
VASKENLGWGNKRWATIPSSISLSEVLFCGIEREPRMRKYTIGIGLVPMLCPGSSFAGSKEEPELKENTVINIAYRPFLNPRFSSMVLRENLGWGNKR